MKDLFSTQSNYYAQFRPLYPKELYTFLSSLTKEHHKVWDAGTGNGQVARELANIFDQVIASDISEAQLNNAPQMENITYIKAAEELPGVPDNTFDLVTVATAIHWFDFEKFYAEVKRVAKKDARLAVWCYDLIRVNEELDPLIDAFSNKTLYEYWDKERRYVDEGYRTIPFPFREVETPSLSIKATWSLEHIEGYFNSWSAVAHYKKAHNSNPVDAFIEQIRPLWKDKQNVEFFLHIRVGIVE